MLLHAGTATHGAHGVQAGSQLGVLLLDLKLGAGGFGVGDGVDYLGLGASQLSSALEVLESLGNLALLEEELGHGSNGNVALGINWSGISIYVYTTASRKLTDQGLLAEVLSLLEVLLPLEQSKSLVNQGQDIDTHGFALLLHLDGLVELLDGLGVVLLVEQKLTVVVVHIGDVLEVLNCPSESGHR